MNPYTKGACLDFDFRHVSAEATVDFAMTQLIDVELVDPYLET